MSAAALKSATVLALGVMVLCLALGCSSNPVVRERFLTVSTKTNVAPPHEVLGPVATSYCDHLALLIFPWVHDQREVYSELLEQARRLQGDAIVDFRISMRDTLWFFPVYLKGCWHAEATAIRYE
jgi:hypothetical protein